MWYIHVLGIHDFSYTSRLQMYDFNPVWRATPASCKFSFDCLFVRAFVQPNIRRNCWGIVWECLCKLCPWIETWICIISLSSVKLKHVTCLFHKKWFIFLAAQRAVASKIRCIHGANKTQVSQEMGSRSSFPWVWANISSENTISQQASNQSYQQFCAWGRKRCVSAKPSSNSLSATLGKNHFWNQN